MWPFKKAIRKGVYRDAPMENMIQDSHTNLDVDILEETEKSYKIRYFTFLIPGYDWIDKSKIELIK